MKNNVKKSLFILIGCLCAIGSYATVIYESDLLQTGSGYTTAGNGTFSTSAVSWASQYSNYWKTGSSTNKTTLTFSPAIDLSGYSNVKMTVYWGHSSKGKPIRIYVNDTEITTATSGTMTATESNTLYTAAVSISGNSISTIAFQGKSSSGLHVFHFTIEGDGGSTPPSTVAVTGVALNKTTTSISVGAFETLTATVSPNNATNKAVTWSSNNTAVATVDSNGKVTGVSVGTANITVTTTDGGFTAQCAVTVTAAPSDPVLVTGITLNKSSETIKVGNTLTITATVSPSNATNQNLNWTSSNTSIATVSNGVVTGVTAGGPVTITASSTDGSNKSATCQVTVEENTTPVPESGLAKHEPETYEAKEIAGGYNTPLTVVNGHEYEVYYINRDATGKLLTIATSNVDKAGSISDDDLSSDKTTVTKDNWAKISSSNGTGGDSNAGKSDEFENSIRSVKFNSFSHELVMHIQGYDQFSFYGKDNNSDASKNKMFQVYIDDIKQAHTPSDYAIHRFNISTKEHVIRISAIGGSDSKLCSFSLRVAQEPRTKHISGNDTAQVVLQTQAIKPVVYTTKYNNISGAETRLEWIGAEATGISLSKTTGDISDTLTLSGVANCPIGTYNYAIVAYYNGQETNRATGTFTVKSDIKAVTDNLNITVYNGEAMEQIKFRYYALSANDVQLTWGANGQPSGISGSGNNGNYTIGGTPNVSGTLPMTFLYEITVAGADTVFKGAITVKELVHTDKDVLFLYENTTADNTPIFNFLKEKGWNPVERKALSQLRPADQYGYYKWILISEDVNANNGEVLAVDSGKANLPVLNMKSFSYSPDRLDWGEPDNGSLDTVTNNRYNIIVQRADHPIFQKLGWQQGEKKQILSNIDRKGLMPVRVDYDGTLCLATAYTRSIHDYYKDGELQTFLHEVPASMRNGKKYLCMPIAYASSQYLTDNGKNLLKAAIDYLTSNEATVGLPELEITRFAIGNIAGEINQMDNTILVVINEKDHPDLALAALKPTITLKDPTLTHVSPASGEEENFASSISFPVEYIVSDYINRRIYNVTVRTYSPQGIDEVYTDGEWVNVFDIYGRLIATTNENIYTMSLPRGMYLIVTSGGKTIKLMK